MIVDSSFLGLSHILTKMYSVKGQTVLGLEQRLCPFLCG